MAERQGGRRRGSSTAVVAEAVSQLLSAGAIVLAYVSVGYGALFLFFVAPFVGLLDGAVFLVGRALGARDRTGVLAWGFYATALLHPAMIAWGMLTRVVGLFGERRHLAMLAVAVTAAAMWPTALGGVQFVERGGADGALAGAAGLAVLAAFAQWWALWRRRVAEVDLAEDPARLAEVAEEAAQKERDEADAIRRMFRS